MKMGDSVTLSRGGFAHHSVATLAAGGATRLQVLFGGWRGFGRGNPATTPGRGARGWRMGKAALGHSHADGHQADGGVGVPGDALHHAAHRQGLHAASRAHLPEPHRAVIGACGTGWGGPGSVPGVAPPRGRCAGGCHGSAQQHGAAGHVPKPEGRAAGGTQPCPRRPRFPGSVSARRQLQHHEGET